MSATSKTIIRMWNKEGYHKDVAILDSDQVRMRVIKVTEPTGSMLMAGPTGISLVVDPSEFPEAVCFQVLVVEYPRR